MHQKRFSFFSLILMFVFSASLAWSQSVTTGGVAGTVMDQSGSTVPDATVTLKSQETGTSQTQSTSSTGAYQFSLLRPGNYVLTVTKQGFKTLTQTMIVQLGQINTVNATLEVGSSASTIEVTGEAALLQTENANIATNYEVKQIQEVPNPGGDITYIAQTAPGVTMNNSTGGGYGNFSTFGLPGTANLFTINGNDYNDAFLNLNDSGSSNLLLGGNEMQEVAVVNNAYTGQYGRQAGSQVDYTTKSGSDSFHGNAIYNWTGRDITANDPLNKAFSPAGGPINPRPFENNNQWAASIGGPIIKNKAFFFLDNEGIRYIFGSVHSVSVPTPAFQSFVLSQPAIAGNGSTTAFYQNLFKLYNGASGIQNAAPVTPDPTTTVGKQCVALLGGAPCVETFGQSVPNGNREWLLNGRVDYNINANNQIFGHFGVDRGVQPTYTDSINPAFNDNSVQPQDAGQFSFTHTFSPTVINNFNANLLWYQAIFGSTNPGPALALFPGNLNFVDGAFTALGTGSGNPGGYGQGFLYPQGRNVTQWGLIDDLSVTRGAHSFKMGINWRRDDVSDHTAQEQTLYPAVNTTLAAFANNQIPANGFTQYNFALTPVQPVAFYSVGFYFQDEFRATSNLKLTLTLRADRNSGGVCQHACASLPAVAFTDLPHGPNIPYNQSFQTGLTTIAPGNEKVVFQPRFGLAWTPWGSKTVIRTGVGLFTDLYPGTILSSIDTNFPQVNLWGVPGGPGVSLAWDLNSPSSTTFPTSGVALVQGCNSAFASNYANGGNLTTFQAAAPAACATTPTVNDISRNLRNPKYVEWNFEIQHSLNAKTVVSANYVGNRGYDLLYTNPDLNGFGFGSLGFLTAAPDPRVGRVNLLTNGGISNYNGVVLSIQENGFHGLSGSFSYTYSHALDDVSNGGVLPFSVITSITSIIDPTNLRANYASADYDARHQLSAQYIYELPFKSQRRALNYLIGGWQLSGTEFWRTGFPFSFVDGFTAAGLVGNNLGGSVPLLQPTFSQRNFSNVSSCVASPCFGLVGSGAPFQLTTATNFTGAVGRNAFRGPGFLGGDMSVRKNFNLNERFRLQLGLEAYNWLNHTNWGTPYPNTNAPFFGSVITTETSPTSPYGAFAAAATDMRIAQLTAKVFF